MAKERVFVDTNVIIESFRTGCWTAICQRYAIETVEKCIEEAMTGDPTDPRYVPVDAEVLNAGLAARHAVQKVDIATLVLAFPHAQGHRPRTTSGARRWPGGSPGRSRSGSFEFSPGTRT